MNKNSVNVQREIWSKEKEVETNDDDFQRLYSELKFGKSAI